jgi:hypothetical protein
MRKKKNRNTINVTDRKTCRPMGENENTPKERSRNITNNITAGIKSVNSLNLVFVFGKKNLSQIKSITGGVINKEKALE